MGFLTHQVRRGVTLAAAAALSVAPFAVSDAHAVESASASDPTQFELPQRWNSDYEPGTECSTPGENGTYLTAKKRWFKQTDASSVANNTANAVPVSTKVKQSRTQTLQVSAKVAGQGDLAKIMTQTFGFTYVNEVHWSLKQVVGPYPLPAGKEGRLAWGFIILDADAQNVHCAPNLSWQATGRPYHVSAPESRYAELQIDNPEYEDLSY